MEKVIVVCFLALVLSMSPANAIDCVSLIAGLHPCKNYLSSFTPVTPSLQCCDSATILVAEDDSDGLCQCLRQNPFGSSFLPSKAQQLPNLCNITSFLPLAKCLTPPGNIISASEISIPTQLPGSPLFPLPPWIRGSGAPLIPLPPLFPGPGSPLIPLPPLIPGSGSPFIPFPPLFPGSGSPLIPLPPLFPGSGSPLIPLPPLFPGSGSPLTPLPPLFPGSGSLLIPLPPSIPGSGSKTVHLPPMIPGTEGPVIGRSPVVPGPPAA